MVTKGIIYLATDTFPEITVECTYSLLPASMYRHWQHWTDVYAEVVVEFSFANFIWEYIYCLTWGISDNHLTIRLCRDSLVSTLHSVWQTIYDGKFGPVWGICLSKSYTTGYSGLPRIPSPHFPTHRTSCGGLQNFGPENTTPPSKNWDCSWMKLQSRIAPPPNWDVSWRTFCHGLVCRDYPRGYTSRSMEWFQ